MRSKEELCHSLTRTSSHKGENSITMLNISKMTRPGSETSISQSFTMPGLIAQDYDVKVALLPRLLPNSFDVPSTSSCYEYCTVTPHLKDWGTWMLLMWTVVLVLWTPQWQVVLFAYMHCEVNEVNILSKTFLWVRQKAPIQSLIWNFKNIELWMSGFAHDTLIILHSNSGGFNLHQNNLCCTLEVTLALYIYEIPW